MKKVVYSLLALAASTLVFSCIKNTAEEPVVNSQAEKFITVTCTINTPAPDSKVTLTKEDGKGKTKWVEGDEVFFHGAFVGTSGDDVYSYVAAAHDVSADGKSASFTIPAIAKRFNHDEIEWRDAKYKTDLYAVYPASAVADFNAKDEWYFISAFKETNHLLLAGCNDTRVDDGMTFEFMNLTGALSFVVSDDGITGGFDAYAVCGNDGETVGYTNYCVKMDINGDSDTKDYRTLYVGNDGPGPSSGELSSILVEDWNGANGTTVNTVFFPNGVNFASGFTIKFLKGGNEVRRVSTKTAAKIDVGKWLDLGDVTSRLYIYEEEVDPTSSHKSAITGATDISALQANCYLITAPGSYKFKSLIGISAEPTLHVHDVALLWETYNNNEVVVENSVIEAVDFEDDWIYFKTPATLKPGNALIAAKDHKGNIVWSWHIWIPAEKPATIDATEVAGLNMMDRNLGALVITDKTAGAAVESFGLYYQYGRKDPFLGPNAIGSDVGLATVAEGQVSNTLNGGSMTVNESIAKPTVFGNVSGGNWQSTSKSKWDASEKTDYDPCPSGYRIAYGAKGSSATYPLWNSSNIKTAAAEKGWDESSEGHWFKIGTGAGELVFPLAGYYDDNQGSSLTPTHAYDRAGIWFMPTNSSSVYHINIRIGSTYQCGSTSAARGCTIRCVAIPAE